MGKGTYADWELAFHIFSKYENEAGIFTIDDFYIMAGPDPEKVSEGDKAALSLLDWYADESYNCFYKVL